MNSPVEKFIGNKSSKQFHKIVAGSKEKGEKEVKECWWKQRLMQSEPTETSGPVVLTSLHEAIYEGYDGCFYCLPEYDGVSKTGLLDVQVDLGDKVSGYFLYPANRMEFSTKIIDENTVEASFTINGRAYSIQQTLDINGVPVSQSIGGDALIVQIERRCLELFLTALSKYMKETGKEKAIHFVLLGRLVLAKLSGYRGEAKQSKSKTDKGELTTGIMDLINGILEFVTVDVKETPCNMLEDYPVLSVMEGSEKKTGIVGIGEWLNVVQPNWHRYEERRSSPCLYKGEAVQAFWLDADGKEISMWAIVDGLYGGNNFGRAGSLDLLGAPIDFFTGWTYKAADHDACNGRYGEGEVFGACSREFFCAVAEFLTAPLLGCNGEDPPPHMVIQPAELEQGYYEYTTVHPMAGRKINTPADWQVNLDENRWQAPAEEEVPAEVSGVKATPNPFTQKTGTAIAFSLNQEAHVTIRLYHQDGFNMNMLCRDDTFAEGEHSVFWDGNNASEFPAALGYYDVEFVVNGVAKRFSRVVRKMAYAEGALPETDMLSNVKVSRNPFSIDTRTYICFDLAEEKFVTINIYHQNHTFRPINIVRTLADNKIFKKGHHEICWDGYRNSRWLKIQALNGAYKVRILIDGKEKVINNVIKVRSV